MFIPTGHEDKVRPNYANNFLYQRTTIIQMYWFKDMRYC